MGFSIDFHYGSQRTTAEAVHNLKAELQIQIRFPGFDARLVFHRVQNAAGPANVTGRSHTNVNAVTSLGNQAERFIKGRNMQYPG